MSRILVIGPSPEKSKGGMATVIEEIMQDEKLNSDCDIDIFDSYIDGNKLKVILFSVWAYLKFIIGKKNYDIYHIHAASRGSTFRKGYYVRAANRWGKKVILHIHGARYMEFFASLSQKKKQQVINILKSADMVIALSEDWKRKFDNTFGLENCVVLENGINMNRLETAVTKPEMYQKSFLMLGRLGERKGTYDLVDAVDKAKNSVPDIKCYLAGDGEIEKFRQMAEERHLKNNIEVIGWADFNKKLSLLGKVSTVVLPSYNEGLPMAILEGMACGKAIISTTVGAIPEVIEDENGILVEAGDVDALSDALVTICSDSDYLNKVSESNIEKIRNKFSMEYMHGKLLEYYKAV